jgi:hypothetical protein
LRSTIVGKPVICGNVVPKNHTLDAIPMAPLHSFAGSKVPVRWLERIDHRGTDEESCIATVVNTEWIRRTASEYCPMLCFRIENKCPRHSSNQIHLIGMSGGFPLRCKIFSKSLRRPLPNTMSTLRNAVIFFRRVLDFLGSLAGIELEVSCPFHLSTFQWVIQRRRRSRKPPKYIVEKLSLETDMM